MNQISLMHAACREGPDCSLQSSKCYWLKYNRVEVTYFHGTSYLTPSQNDNPSCRDNCLLYDFLTLQMGVSPPPLTSWSYSLQHIDYKPEESVLPTFVKCHNVWLISCSVSNVQFPHHQNMFVQAKNAFRHLDFPCPV